MNKERLDGENVFVIHGFLSGEECDGLIARSEALGYEAATEGDVLVTRVRNNARVILDDPGLAAALWDEARPFVPPVRGWEPVGFNERFRFCRPPQSPSPCAETPPTCKPTAPTACIPRGVPHDVQEVE